MTDNELLMQFGYTDFDYLCNEKFYIGGLGHVKCPTLREIRNVSYFVFASFVDIISLSVGAYVERYQYDDIDPKENNMYDVLLVKSPELLIMMLDFFVEEEFEYQSNNEFSGFVFALDGDEYGYITHDNFDRFRESLRVILGVKDEEKPPKFKSKKARYIYEKIEREKKKIKTKNRDETYTMGNMIRKYCTNNHNGINIMNVWDLTYYQFIAMFEEYQYARSCDVNDAIAANSFSYEKSNDYKPLEYMKKIHT